MMFIFHPLSLPLLYLDVSLSLNLPDFHLHPVFYFMIPLNIGSSGSLDSLKFYFHRLLNNNAVKMLAPHKRKENYRKE